MLLLSTPHVAVPCLSAMWSHDDDQLVAAIIHTHEMVSLRAILAELEKNSQHSSINIVKGNARLAELKGAAKGFSKSITDTDKFNAHGYVATLLHHQAGDPTLIETGSADAKSQDKDHAFYVVPARPEDLENLFYERLALALTWPILPQWAEQLMQAGRAKGLVKILKFAQSPEFTGAGFAVGLRVSLDQNDWASVITDLVQSESVRLCSV